MLTGTITTTALSHEVAVALARRYPLAPRYTAPVGKSLIMRATRAAAIQRPLDAAENEARRAESEYSHSEEAHR